MNKDVTSFEKDVVSLRGAALVLRSSLALERVTLTEEVADMAGQG